MLNFEKLDAYKKAVDFVNWVYEITKNFPKIEQFGIISQLRRANMFEVRSRKLEGVNGCMGEDQPIECFLLQTSNFQLVPTREED